MARKAVGVGVLLLVAASGVAQEPRYAVEAAAFQKVDAHVTYELHTTRFPAERWEVYLPCPPELPGQAKVTAAAGPDGKRVAEASPLARPAFRIDAPAAGTPLSRSLTVRLDVTATLMSRRLVRLDGASRPPPVPPLADAERAAYLAATPTFDHDSPAFRDWLTAHKLARRPGEDELALAARVLEEERYQYDYQFDPAEAKRASVACTKRMADCGGMVFVFVAALRANGVPARALVGRLAKPRAAGSKAGEIGYDRPHVRAEFWADGVGWVPVDPNAVQADRRRPVRSFLGTDPGDLLVLHADADFLFPVDGRTERAAFLQLSPFYRAAGPGPPDPSAGPTGWAVRVTPVR